MPWCQGRKKRAETATFHSLSLSFHRIQLLGFIFGPGTRLSIPKLYAYQGVASHVQSFPKPLGSRGKSGAGKKKINKRGAFKRAPALPILLAAKRELAVVVCYRKSGFMFFGVVVVVVVVAAGCCHRKVQMFSVFSAAALTCREERLNAGAAGWCAEQAKQWHRWLAGSMTG